MALENSLTDNTPGIHARWASTTHLWTALRVILAVAVNVALLAAIAMPIRAYISPPGPHTPWFAWCIALTWQPVMALQAVVFFRWVDRRPLRELPLGFDRRARSAALWGAVLSVGLMAAYVGLTELGGLATWHWNAGFAPAATVLTALLTAMAGLGEEMLFRGYLLRTISHYGPRAAVVVSSLVFALMHMLVGRVSPLDQLALFLHGLLFAILAQRSKSLWPGVIIHFVYNGLTSLVWSGSSTTALFAFDGSLGWTKWAFKAAMVIPYLLLVWYIYRKQQRTAVK